MLFEPGRLYSLSDVARIGHVSLTAVIMAGYRGEVSIKRQAKIPFILGSQADTWVKKFKSRAMQDARELAEARREFRNAVVRGYRQ